jgi:hypothetical protein
MPVRKNIPAILHEPDPPFHPLHAHIPPRTGTENPYGTFSATPLSKIQERRKIKEVGKWEKRCFLSHLLY